MFSRSTGTCDTSRAEEAARERSNVGHRGHRKNGEECGRKIGDAVIAATIITCFGGSGDGKLVEKALQVTQVGNLIQQNLRHVFARAHDVGFGVLVPLVLPPSFLAKANVINRKPNLHGESLTRAPARNHEKQLLSPELQSYSVGTLHRLQPHTSARR
jgi:hypothetical protein